MISSINFDYLTLRHNNSVARGVLIGWKKKTTTIKKQYFRKYQVKVWLHKNKYLLIRPYLINSNLWYTGKKGVILNYSLCKAVENTLLTNSLKTKVNSIVSDYNKKI